MTAELPARPIPGAVGSKWAAAWRDARYDHAVLLRLDGLTYREIADRMGIVHERARQLTIRGARRLAWATRRTRWRWETPHG